MEGDDNKSAGTVSVIEKFHGFANVDTCRYRDVALKFTGMHPD